MKGSKLVKSDWFEVPHFGYWLVIIPSLFFMEILYLAPDLLPLDSMGPIGALGRYFLEGHPKVLQAIFIGANITHLFEGAWAFALCRQLQLNAWASFKWTLQTIMIGFSSLGKLRAKAQMSEKKK